MPGSIRRGLFGTVFALPFLPACKHGWDQQVQSLHSAKGSEQGWGGFLQAAGAEVPDPLGLT